MPVQKLQSEEEFTALFEQYWEALYDYALTCTQQPEAAQDLVQDLFANIWIKRHKIAVQTTWKQYLFTALKNLVIDAHRANKIGLIPLPEDDKMNAAQEHQEQYESKFSLRSIHTLTNQLTPKQKHIFNLHRFQGFSIREISQLLSVSENTVKAHLQESTKKIRSLFNW